MGSNPLQFFLCAVGSEIITAIPLLFVSAFSSVLGIIAGILLLVGELLFLVFKLGAEYESITHFLVPSLLAILFVECLFNGVDSSPVLLIIVVYSLVWPIIDGVVKVIQMA